MTVSGIYKILNITNAKCYVGSAVNLKKRAYQHFKALYENKHFNIKLQNEYNEAFKENFKFEILEIINDKEKLIEREQYYLDTLKPEYNLNPTAGSRLGSVLSEQTKIDLCLLNIGKRHSAETKKKMSRGRVGNQIRRNKEKYPHPEGCKCKCDDCKEIRLAYFRIYNAKRPPRSKRALSSKPSA